jgi:hypothetical protein
VRVAYDGSPVLVAGKTGSLSSGEAPLSVRWVRGVVARRGNNNSGSVLSSMGGACRVVLMGGGGLLACSTSSHI